MISYKSIQRAYDNLYKVIREYIWGFPVVEALADLEIESYKTCPDIVRVRSKLNNLKLQVLDVIREDEELDKAFENFNTLISESDDVYAKLTQVKEVVQQ